MPYSHHIGSYSYLFFFLSLLLILQSPKTRADFLWDICPTEANYTTNSTFRTNLDLLLTSLSSSTVAAGGFYNDTKGQSPDQVHGLALCRGDASSTVCQTCLDAAIQDIIQKCPHGMRLTICYDDCLLRYSDESFFSTVDTSFRYWAWNHNNVSNQQQFSSLLGNLMDSLTMKARSSSKLFAAGSVNITNFSRLYGLVQCTRDLSADDCYLCLRDRVGFIPSCCSWKEGGKVYVPSCYLRFESYPFYNLSVEEAPPSPSNRTANDTGPNEASGGK